MVTEEAKFGASEAWCPVAGAALSYFFGSSG